MDLHEIIMSDRYEYLTLAVDFALIVVLLTLAGRMTGLVANVSSVHELSHRDNYAFGISYAAAILSVGIVMMGAVSGDATISLVYEAMIVGAYGLAGIVLMSSARHILDRFSLPAISIKNEIAAGNMSAAIVDASNMIATALIVRAAMIWVDTESFKGLLVVLFAFIVSQLLMTLVTRYRLAVYARRHNGENLQKQFEAGNKAIALRYAGHKIGVALAVTAASGIVDPGADVGYEAVVAWGLASLGMTIILSALSIIARHVIVHGVDVVEEVDRQQNLGIGLIEATIYLVNGAILVALFAVAAS